MAAPVENVCEDDIDILSSNFDPVRALYSSEINIPFPEVKIFNNVAEYESSFSKKEKQLPSRNQLSKSSQIPTQRPSTSKHNTSRPTEQPVLRMPDASMPAARQRILRNVLTRMDQSFVSGPLSILRRCVQEKLKAYVWTRSARSVRGILKGYVIAFDKHFNLALIDVDEVYRIPSVCRKKRRKKFDADPSVEDVMDTETPLSEKSRMTGRMSVKDRLSLPLQSHSSQSHRTHTEQSHKHSLYKERSAQWESSLPCEAAWLGMRREDLRCRHVNQLFVRGDNVVCVNVINTDT